MVRLLTSLLVILALALARAPLVGATVALAAPEDAPPAQPSGVSSAASSMTWFFAEGSTADPFDTWILLFNPNSNASANVSLTLFFPSGAPTTRNFVVGPSRRLSIFVDPILPNVPAFGTRVDSSLPILAERAIYFNRDGGVSFGATAPQTTWLFAEGSTQPPFDTWFLVLNPGSAPASVTFEFFTSPRSLGAAGNVGSATFTIGPTSRFSLFANQIFPGFSFPLSTRVTSTQPIVVERSMFDRNSGGGHNVLGVSAGASAWNFAEGSTAPPFQTYFLLFNPNNSQVSISARLFPESGGPGPLLEFTLNPLSRTTIFANDIFPNRSFASLWLVNQPQNATIVVERAMYFFKPNAGSHATVGAPTGATVWRFAEGATAAPFDEWLLLSNPSQAGAANVTVTFINTADGSVMTTRTFQVGERTSIFVNQIVPNAPNVSILVTSDLPITAERSMYFGQGGTNTIGSPG